MIYRDGVEWAESSAEAASLLGPNTTAANVRDWIRRSRNPADPLHGVVTPHRPNGQTRGRMLIDTRETARAERITSGRAHQRQHAPDAA